MSQTWIIPLPWKSPPLHLNQRLHWAAEAAIVAQTKHRVRGLVIGTHVPRLEHATVTLVWTVPDQKIRDEENPVPTLKAACDALKDDTYQGIRLLGIVPDDSPEWMTKRMPVIRYRKGCSAMHLIITGDPLEAVKRGRPKKVPA